jgi:hypothetical protein
LEPVGCRRHRLPERHFERCGPRASRDEVLAHRETLLTLAAECGLADPRLRDDGAVVVTSAGSRLSVGCALHRRRSGRLRVLDDGRRRFGRRGHDAPVTASEYYARRVRTLREIAVLVPRSRSRWDNDRVLRLAVMRLRIDPGTFVEAYRRAAMFAARVEPWSSLVGYREMLAHRLPRT